ncbi:hypothetical protein HID58_006930, partial [Brassica napus]
TVDHWINMCLQGKKSNDFFKKSLVDLHLKPSEEDLKQWPDIWRLNIDFFRNINGKPFRFLIRCWLLLTSLTRMTQFQELELEKQPSSSKWRLQSLARKRQDQNGVNTTMFSNWTIAPVLGNREASTEAHNEKEWVEQDAHGVCISLTALASGVTDLKPEKGLVRKKQNCGGHITEEEESTKNTIYEWLTKPVRKYLTEILLHQPLL